MGGKGKCMFDGFRLGSGQGRDGVGNIVRRGRRDQRRPGDPGFMRNYLRGLGHLATAEDEHLRNWMEFQLNCMEEDEVYVLSQIDGSGDVHFEFPPFTATEQHLWNTRQKLKLNDLKLKLKLKSEMGASLGSVASAPPGSAAPAPPVPEALPKADPGPPPPHYDRAWFS